MWVHVLYFPSLAVLFWILYRSLILLLAPAQEDKTRFIKLLELRIAIAFLVFLLFTQVVRVL